MSVTKKEGNRIFLGKIVQVVLVVLWFIASLWFLLKNIDAKEWIFIRYLSRDLGYSTFSFVGGGLHGIVATLSLWGILSPLFLLALRWEWGGYLPGILGCIPSIILLIKWTGLAWSEFAEINSVWGKIFCFLPVLVMWFGGIIVAASIASPLIIVFYLNTDYAIFMLLGVTLLGAVVAGIIGFIAATIVFYIENIVIIGVVALLIICAFGGLCEGGRRAIVFFIEE